MKSLPPMVRVTTSAVFRAAATSPSASASFRSRRAVVSPSCARMVSDSSCSCSICSAKELSPFSGSRPQPVEMLSPSAT